MANCELAVMVFHPIAGRWRPACLRVATASVETVSPPFSVILPRCCKSQSAGAFRCYHRERLQIEPGSEQEPDGGCGQLGKF